MCEYCNGFVGLIYQALKSGDTNDFAFGSVNGFEQGARQGCRLCALISNGFQNSGHDFPIFHYWFETNYGEMDGDLILGFIEVWTVSFEGAEHCYFHVQRKPGDSRRLLDS